MFKYIFPVLVPEDVSENLIFFVVTVILLLSPILVYFAFGRKPRCTLSTKEDSHTSVKHSKSNRASDMAESLSPSQKSHPVRDDQQIGPYSDPVYKKIAHRNGEINKMSRDDMRRKLAKLGLDTRGVKEVLKKRLKNHYKRQQLGKAHVLPPGEGEQKLDYLLVIDFEATCEEYNPSAFQYEIIEFPVVLIDVHEKKVVDIFHEYVKPLKNPRLSGFCVSLTGIQQKTVDSASVFPDVLARVEQWIEKHRLKEHKFAVVSDGPWDMSRFMHMQCIISDIPFPKWGKKWINIRKSYSNFYGFQRVKLAVMLENLGMTFEGQQHSGIDDAQNIARIVLRMLNDGFVIRINERLYAGKDKIKSAVETVSKREADYSGEDAENGFVLDSYDDQGEGVEWSRGKSKANTCTVSSVSANQHKSEDLLRHDLQNLHLRSRTPSPEEQYDDLLSYYALQSNS